MDGIGTVAIDVKAYTVRTRRIVLHGEGPIEQEELYGVRYVKLVWNEILALREFERVSNIQTWICLYISADAYDVSFLYRVEDIYDAYAPIFVAQDRNIWDWDRRPVELFDEWTLDREVDPAIPSEELAFDFVIDDGNADLYSAADHRSFMPFNVPPIIVNLNGDSLITDLIVFARSEFGQRPPSDAQFSYASAIAKALGKALPDNLDRWRCSNFIERNRPEYDAQRAGRTKL